MKINTNVQLIENYNAKKHWECISCGDVLFDEEMYIERASYLLHVNPNNARICLDCLANIIRAGHD